MLLRTQCGARRISFAPLFSTAPDSFLVFSTLICYIGVLIQLVSLVFHNGLFTELAYLQVNSVGNPKSTDQFVEVLPATFFRADLLSAVLHVDEGCLGLAHAYSSALIQACKHPLLRYTQRKKPYLSISNELN